MEISGEQKNPCFPRSSVKPFSRRKNLFIKSTRFILVIHEGKDQHSNGSAVYEKQNYFCEPSLKSTCNFFKLIFRLRKIFFEKMQHQVLVEFLRN